MASNNDLAPSPLDLLAPPPPSPPPSSPPPHTHSTNTSCVRSRPIPIEIYNHILHFAFGRHLPPLPLVNRLDEPSSISHLLPLTLVSKGLRELVLPYLYDHLFIRRPEGWIQLLDPRKGLLVGEGEDETRRRGWVTKLSFARDGFPVSSWTPWRDRHGQMERRKPEPNMAPLDFSGFGELEEVYIGDWGRDEDVINREIEAAVEDEMAKEPYLAFYHFTEAQIRQLMVSELEQDRSSLQTSSIVDLLDETRALLVHASFEPFYSTTRPRSLPAPFPSDFILYPSPYELEYDEEEDNVEQTARTMAQFQKSFPLSRFDLDLVLLSWTETMQYAVVEVLGDRGWEEDEDDWWTWEDPSTA